MMTWLVLGALLGAGDMVLVPAAGSSWHRRRARRRGAGAPRVRRLVLHRPPRGLDPRVRRVRAAGQAADRVEGFWFRYSVEGCLDLLERFERRYGGTLAALPAGVAAADLVRWRAAAAALRGLAGELPAEPPPPCARGRPAGAARARGGAAGARGELARRRGVRRLGGQASADRGRVGEGRARHRRARLSLGRGLGAERVHAGQPVDAGPARAGSHPRSASPYGAEDLAGNVWSGWPTGTARTSTGRRRRHARPDRPAGARERRAAGPEPRA